MVIGPFFYAESAKNSIFYNEQNQVKYIKMTTKNVLLKNVVILVRLNDLIFFTDKYSFNSLTDYELIMNFSYSIVKSFSS